MEFKRLQAEKDKPRKTISTEWSKTVSFLITDCLECGS